MENTHSKLNFFMCCIYINNNALMLYCTERRRILDSFKLSCGNEPIISSKFLIIHVLGQFLN